MTNQDLFLLLLSDCFCFLGDVFLGDASEGARDISDIQTRVYHVPAGPEAQELGIGEEIVEVICMGYF